MTEPAKKNRSTISESFLSLNLDKEVKILDVACGIGVVAEEIRPHGYTNIDGLDPVEGYLQVAQEKKLYKVGTLECQVKKEIKERHLLQKKKSVHPISNITFIYF